MTSNRFFFVGLMILTVLWAKSISAQESSIPATRSGTATLADDVTLAVSSLSKTGEVTVPDVLGLSRHEARITLESARLKVGEIDEEFDSAVLPDHVISERPSAGTNVKAGSQVGLWVAKARDVKVPDVIGLTVSAAKEIIIKSGLDVGRISEEPSAKIAAGLVLREHPHAAVLVKAGSRVHLVVSSGPARVKVPNVVGISQAAATTAIADAGLSVGTVTKQSSATVAVDAVISETPAAGTTVTSGSAVNLAVSTGTPKVLVPNVVGLTQAAATTEINSAGLVLGNVTMQSSSSVAAGLVISESPTAGSIVLPNSAVSFVVSTGVATVAVPNVVGMTQTAATTAFTAAGLVVGNVTTQSSSSVAAGLVISESPIAASSVPSGTAVDLVVSSGTATAQIFVDPNPAESTIAVVNAGQNLVTYTGTKAPSGLAQSIAAVVVDGITQDPSKRVVITVDGQGRPATSTLADGSSVSFSYVSSTEIDLTFVDNEGEQGTFSFNPTTGAILSAKPLAASGYLGRSLMSTHGTWRSAARPHSLLSSNSSSGPGSLTVSCTNGNPISDATITGTFTPAVIPPGLPTTFTLPVWPTMVSPGVYSYPAPSSPFQSNPMLLQQLIDSIPPFVTNFCELQEQMDTVTKIFTGADILKYLEATGFSVYLAAAAPEIVLQAVAAVEFVCTANGILSTSNTIAKGIAQGIDYLESGGTLQFQATYPPATPQTTPAQSYGWLSPTPPSFAITFPCITIQITPANPQIPLGGTLQLAASGADSKTAAPTPITPLWEYLPANTSVLTVNSAGLAAGYSLGTATIKVTDQTSGTSAVANATVVPIALQISPASPIVDVGGTTTLTVTASDAAGVIQTPANLQWTSSDQTIATVSSGTVTGVAAGTATITVTDLASQATTSVTVTVAEQGFWQGSYTLTGCIAPGYVGSGNPCAYVVISLALGAGGSYSGADGLYARLGTSESNNIRIEHEFDEEMCSATTGDIATANTFSDTYAMTGVLLGDAESTTLVFTITSRLPTTISGTFSASFNYPIANNGVAVGTATGTWTLVPRTTSFPKCLTNGADLCTASGANFDYDTSYPGSCTWIDPSLPAPPGEWQGLP